VVAAWAASHHQAVLFAGPIRDTSRRYPATLKLYIYTVMSTLGELSERLTIYACCLGCDRMVPLDTEALIARLGEDFPIVGVRTRVRCRVCLARTHEIRLLYRLPPGPLIRR
jgi:hypothetical protein